MLRKPCRLQTDGRTDRRTDKVNPVYPPPTSLGGGIKSEGPINLTNHWGTRQNSTQSVGNMPPLPPRHLLPHVLRIMPGNPKYDQFQSKGHHDEKNSQSMTKIPKFDPFHKVKIVPKLEKSTNCDHNLLSSEDAQDTSTCKMPGHFLNGFSGKCLETPNLTHFTKSK